MKAVVLVGGEGTRLRPLTETIPKPLLPFMNRPFLAHVLDQLATHGVDEVILSSFHLEEEFRSFLDEHPAPPAITWITEARPLGTCGAIAGARHLLDDTFLVLNGDVVTDLDLSALVAVHRDRAAVATVALHRVEDARPYGLVETTPEGRVLAFREKPADPVPGEVNAGTYVLEPRVLDGVPGGVAVSIERETYPALIAAGEPVFALGSDAYWRDLGTPEDYLQAHVDALDGLVAGREYPRPLLGEGGHVDPSAVVGEHAVLGPGVRVAARAVVERSVLHRGAIVGRGAAVLDSVLGPGVVVGDGAEVTGSVLAEEAGVGPGARIAEARLGPGRRAPGGGVRGGSSPRGAEAGGRTASEPPSGRD
ncbi:MAG: sugar phosphate nucleotidyltransferase [Actinomycetota bacterium]